MSRLSVAAAALLVGVALAVATSMPVAALTGSHRVTRQDFPPLPGSTPIVIEPHIPTPAPSSAKSSGPSSPPAAPRRAPVLSAQQRSTAIHVALKDRYVKRLVRGKRQHVKRVSIWMSSGTTVRGAVVTLTFERPERVTGEWPALARKPFRGSYAHVRSLQIFVDLQHSRVVAVIPKS